MLPRGGEAVPVHHEVQVSREGGLLQEEVMLIKACVKYIRALCLRPFAYRFLFKAVPPTDNVLLKNPVRV